MAISVGRAGKTAEPEAIVVTGATNMPNDKEDADGAKAGELA